MYTTLDRVLEVVNRLGLTRMHAYDGDGNTIDTAETDSKSELSDLIEELVRNTSGTIRLDCWQQAPARKAGQTKAQTPKVERVSWRVRGLLGAVPVAAAAPTAPHAVGSLPATVTPLMDVETAVSVARMTWELEQVREELKERDENPDEGDDPEQPAPQLDLSKGLFGMTGDQTFQVLSGLKDIVVPLLSPVARGQAIAGTGAAPVSPQELQVLEAMRRFQAAQPDVANGLLTELMTGYGPGATAASSEPSSNGQQ